MLKPVLTAVMIVLWCSYLGTFLAVVQDHLTIWNIGMFIVGIVVLLGMVAVAFWPHDDRTIPTT